MDQGTAAVLAAAVAGFSSAAGAAIGAVLASRSARTATVLTVEDGKASKYEEGRKQSYAAFRSKVVAALDSLTDLVDDLRNDRPVSDETVTRAVGHVRRSLVSDVMPCFVPDVENAASAVYDGLRDALQAAMVLLSSPQDAKDDNSPSMVHLQSRTDSVYVAFELFSSVSGEVTYGR